MNNFKLFHLHRSISLILFVPANFTFCTTSSLLEQRENKPPPYPQLLQSFIMWFGVVPFVARSLLPQTFLSSCSLSLFSIPNQTLCLSFESHRQSPPHTDYYCEHWEAVWILWLSVSLHYGRHAEGCWSCSVPDRQNTTYWLGLEDTS